MSDAILRQTFNAQAELYNDARPKYPTDLFDALIEVSQLPPDANLLEIGPGTGQATAALAQHGYRITAVELGDALAEVAQRELAKYPKVNLITGAFEDVELPAASFDLVYAATAFHWIKPEVKFAKPHTLLKDGGYLAIIHTNHVAKEADDAFFHASQPIYKKYKDDRPKSTKDSKSPMLQVENLKADEMDERLFEPVFFKVFPMTIDYNADDYAKLIGTFSPTLAMTLERREGFLSEIRDLINSQFDGHVTKQYGMSLTIGKRNDDIIRE